MVKPEDISQEAWDKGMAEARFYADWLHAGNSSGSVSPHAVTALADTIARAILAAEQREREACVAIAASMLGENSGIEPASVKWVRAYRNAIRNRGSDNDH